MHLLLLSFYYSPDIGPGALRAKSMVEALIKYGPSDLKIDVITTMPNRYHTFKVLAEEIEQSEKLTIHRIKIPEHKNRMLNQSLCFFLYVIRARKLLLKKKFDIVVVTSGRLMSAFIGACVAKINHAKLYLDIRDLFTEAMQDLLAYMSFLSRIIIPILKIIEKWTFKAANKINVVSPAFVSHIKKISPNLSPSVFTNGIDEEFLYNDFKPKKNNKNITILYAGNIGEGQGLDSILPEAASYFKNIHFKLIGDGGARKKLIDKIQLKSLSNIELLKPIPRNELINEYREADILFLHLNNFKAFQKVLPSKIFEYAATGKPILAGASGYSAEFLKEKILGVEIFDPFNLDEMKISLQKLLKYNVLFDRKSFCKLYLRKNIMENLAKDILSLHK